MYSVQGGRRTGAQERDGGCEAEACSCWHWTAFQAGASEYSWFPIKRVRYYSLTSMLLQ
jgi:hypothetical protein